MAFPVVAVATPVFKNHLNKIKRLEPACFYKSAQTGMKPPQINF
jgi:hypothetical protein